MEQTVTALPEEEESDFEEFLETYSNVSKLHHIISKLDFSFRKIEKLISLSELWEEREVCKEPDANGSNGDARCRDISLHNQFCCLVL